MDVAAWLRGLGLGRYEAAFRDNDVAADVPPELTADDLREIEVASVGDRRRLLAAIAALKTDGAGPAHAAATAPTAAPPAIAEHADGPKACGSGPIRALHRERPGLPVVVTSGSPPPGGAEALRRHAGGDGPLALLHKPLGHSCPIEAVRCALASRRPRRDVRRASAVQAECEPASDGARLQRAGSGRIDGKPSRVAVVG